MIRLELPWPASDLSPNRARNVHWSRKSKAVSSARKTAAILCLEAMVKANYAAQLLPNVSVSFHPADKRRRDLDNCIGSCKSYFDGISDALMRDDSNFTLSFKMGAPEKPACVRVVIS